MQIDILTLFPKMFVGPMTESIMWRAQDKKFLKLNIVDLRQFGIDERKIDVVYSAATDVYQNITNSTVLNKLKKKYALPENYFMYVGDVNWNKNIPGSLKPGIFL